VRKPSLSFQLSWIPPIILSAIEIEEPQIVGLLVDIDLHLLCLTALLLY
jgi:hypothetical protein